MKSLLFFGDPAGARTQDPHIKSVMLYLLSYRVDRFCGCKSTSFFSIRKKIFQKTLTQSRIPLP